MRERLQKILSANGRISRREAERMILEGRVSVNGVPAEIGQSAEFGIDEIIVDNVPLAAKDRFIYIALNKPRGYLTTVSDDRCRKTVMDLVSAVNARVYPVGRLDMNSEGLLIMTNDGEFANRVAHPSYGVEKVYEVAVRGDAREASELLRKPIAIDSFCVQALNTELSKVTENGGTLRITIVEGRNRQIRKMCAACGVKVLSLKRVSIGNVRLGTLKTGRWRYLTGKEINYICTLQCLEMPIKD